MRLIPEIARPLVKRASKDAGAEYPFWSSEDEIKQEEGMYQLAFELEHENVEEYLSMFPLGYSIVYWIFTWEQSRAGERFCTGTDNAGLSVAFKAAELYEKIGLHEEASALNAMITQLSATPEDDDQIECAYNLIDNPYKEDWIRIPYVVDHLCLKAEEYFCVLA